MSDPEAELEDCDRCGNEGWMWDDLSSAMGGTPYKYCDCPHGDRASKEDFAEKDKQRRLQEERSPYKVCDSCNGSGKVKKEN